MQSIRIALAAFLMLGTAAAQSVADDERVRVPEALQDALDLTDAQIEQLRARGAAFREAVRPLAREAATKQRELRTEMRNDPPNEAIVGSVTMELEAIRAEIADLRSEYQRMARGILSAAQVAALGPIEAAAGLSAEVRQAIALNLIAPAGTANVASRARRSGQRGRIRQRRGSDSP